MAILARHLTFEPDCFDLLWRKFDGRGSTPKGSLPGPAKGLCPGPAASVRAACMRGALLLEVSGE